MGVEHREAETDEQCPRCQGPKLQQYERRSLGWGGGKGAWKPVDEPRCTSCTVQDLQQFEREQGGN